MTAHVFSASQISTFEACPRKWAFLKIEGLKEPDKPSAALGTAVHKVIEEWLRDGKEPDRKTPEGDIAFSGLHLLPQPKTVGMELEKPFAITFGGHTFRGYKDIEILATPIVYDHKTTVDLQWAKSESDLPVDVQATLYAADAMMRAKSPHCDLQWTYLRTRGARRAEPVRVRVMRGQITPRLEQTLRSADAMAEALASGRRANDLPFNDKECASFGGCPFLSECNLTPIKRKETDIMTSIADLKKKLEERKKNGINPPPATQTPAPATVSQSSPAPEPATTPPEPATTPPAIAPSTEKAARKVKPGVDAAVLQSLLNQAASLQEINSRQTAVVADILRTAATLAGGLTA